MSLFRRQSGVSVQVQGKRVVAMSYTLVDNWIVMALIATGAWALSCVVDVCFVGNGVYRKASDGPLVAGLFCLVPALLTGITLQVDTIGLRVIVVTALSAIAFLLHVHFYFKALFSFNDAVNAEIFNTLGILVVPILAFLLLGERLALLNYVAIVAAAVGILTLVRFQASKMSRLTIGYLIASVICVSLMMVMQAWALAQTNYTAVVFVFSAAAFIAVLVLFAARRGEQQRIARMCRRFGALFVLLQLLEIGAVLASQRATDLGPSVSLVALLECSLPVFVMVFSWLFAVAARQWSSRRAMAMLPVLSLQTTAAPSKLISMLMIILAIVLVQA
jgi:drug/metabolite transporter (DMT)-like permease